VAVAAALVELTGLGDFVWGPSPAPPAANSVAEKKVLAVLGETERSGRTFLSVDESAGRVLRLLTEAVDAKSVVEVGTSTGYSGLWFCLALQRTSGEYRGWPLILAD
jgi:predicted O-methyltransferase YrrM